MLRDHGQNEGMSSDPRILKGQRFHQVVHFEIRVTLIYQLSHRNALVYALLVTSEICFLKNFCHFHGIRRQFSRNEIRFELFNRISEPEIFSGQKHRQGFGDVILALEFGQKCLKKENVLSNLTLI